MFHLCSQGSACTMLDIHTLPAGEDTRWGGRCGLCLLTSSTHIRRFQLTVRRVSEYGQQSVQVPVLPSSRNMSLFNIVTLLSVVVMTTQARAYYDAIVGEYTFCYCSDAPVFPKIYLLGSVQ
jgi:hypothetical protein